MLKVEVSCRTSRHQAMMMNDDWLLSLGPFMQDEMLPQETIYFTKTTTFNPETGIDSVIYTWEFRDD